ncbi:hypothetical protein [Leptospira kanakyensis]|uniref:hypothetical protein n=1 Tax=Leptospira kanakyensis TaxID=2484968 RepID=UPI00223E53C0|nr:hypothetical protein [Leptospira kanakyensis]MCW7468847.1 hypothetical protein [Leptospira kanakyensis]MCW7479834.1 hypothetical protein [Leptospira kanakyensis]
MERNKQWSELLIVADLTGSMYPYTIQLITWFKLNSLDKKGKSLMFFNDGDLKPDKDKIPLSTGGLYFGQTSSYEDIAKIAEKTMSSGYGGDIEENDVEAVISGIEKCSTCKNVILIADNYASMRDFKFIEKITKPVHIIICGYNGIIHPEYLYLAWKTGGSIHTIEEDILNISKIHEGETIKIGKQNYLIKNQKFIRIKEI